MLILYYMLKKVKDYGLFFLTVMLLLAVVFIFYLDWQGSHRKLTFAMLDVGQGDALFIESPTGTQILVDGGPPRKILGQLRRMMPSYDRTIDSIIITNPDQDHIGGLAEGLEGSKKGKKFEP